VNPKNRTFVIVAGVIVLIVAAALIAVLATGGSDDSTDASDTSGEVAQSRPVEITGEPLAPFADPAADPAVGQASPVVAAAGFDGTPMTIGGASDNPTMLVFLAHWCPHCNAEIPALLEWRDSGAIPPDLQIFGVSTAVSPDRPNYPPGQWLQDKGWEWPVLADDVEFTAGTAYGVTGFPGVILIDADGNVVVRGSGEISIDDLDVLVNQVA
jgi:cytochrome c biogenesis protein CcmG/thiol:disulfide interchange protein DsbE